MENWKQIPIGGVIKKAGNSKKNKTGTWRKETPNVDQEKCIKCGQCVRICPEKIINLNEEKQGVSIDFDYCKGCGVCSKVCPKNAIEMN